MSETPQASGHRYGRLPNDPTKPRLRLRLNVGTTFPSFPSQADNATGIAHTLQMLGNDQYGDCVAVCWANDRYLVTNDLTDRAEYPTQDQVFTLYKTQNPRFPSQDDGMVIQDALNYLRKTGGPDGSTAVAFAEIDYSDVNQLKAAIAIFGAVWLGVTVSQANENQFPNSAWNPVHGSPILGGHAVPAVGYDDAYIKFLTWAEETEFTDQFRQQQVEEAWVVIWPELFGSRAFLEGVDIATLASDYKALTGNDLPVPAPPSPTPTPTPTPDPGAAPFLDASPEVSARIERVAAREGLTVTQYQERHWRSYFDMPKQEVEE